MVTSDQAAALPPDIADEASYVVAPEVRSLSFSYYDGTSWQDSWDGTTTGSDGVTPIGPPLAVAITIDIASSSSGSSGQSGVKVKTYRHVVSMTTANGATAQQNTGQNAGQNGGRNSGGTARSGQ